MTVSVARTRSATDNYLRHPSVLYRRIDWNSRGIYLASTASGAFQVGSLPPGALPVETIVRINTAFNSGNLTISTTGSSGAFVSAADLAEGSTGNTIVDRCVAQVAYSTAEIPIYAAASSAATAGQADVWIRYYEPEGSADSL